MTRKDKFKKEYQFALDLENYMEFYNGYLKGVRSGIEFADENPDWHKYPDEKPLKEKEYLLLLKNMKCIVAKFYAETQNYCAGFETKINIFTSAEIEDDFIMAWMELPKIPNFD